VIHSAIVRLTLFYLAIIAALSIGFSMSVYRISSQEFDRPARPRGPYSRLEPDIITDYEDILDTRAEQGRAHLRRNLILLNIVTVTLGAAASYAFARRTLQPIDEAMEAQGRFTADASHELRTPLTAMQTEIEVGLRNPKLKLTEAKQLLKSTLEEVGKLSALANGLLRLTRGNGQDLPMKPVDSSSVIIAAIEQVEPARRVKQITIEKKLAKNLPILGDEYSLRELFVILLDNAIKYSPEKTTVSVASRPQGKRIVISVQDHGYGMKASDIPHVFERFYRADTSRTRQNIEGYGLGLSIAKQIANVHHGSIEIQSTPGQGSTFAVKLPSANERDY
jgi:two-component system sensor histidine kinase CiaH